MILFSLLLFTGITYGAEDCSFVDLRQKGEAAEKLKPLHQVYGSCFANAASQLIDAYRFSHGETYDGRQTDPLYLAVQHSILTEHQTEIMSGEKDIFTAGNIFTVTQNLSTHPFCLTLDAKTEAVFIPKSNLYEMSRKSEKTTLEQLIKITDRLSKIIHKKRLLQAKRDYGDFLNRVVQRPDATDTRFSVDPMVAIENERKRVDEEILAFTFFRAKFEQTIQSCRSDSFLNSIYNANIDLPYKSPSTPADLLQKTLEKGCLMHPPIDFHFMTEENLAQYQKIWATKNARAREKIQKTGVFVTFYALSLEERRNKLVSMIKSGGQPIGLSIEAFELMDKKPGLATSSNHQVIAIGRRMHQGKCQILMRNSWGTCDPKKINGDFPNTICDTNAFWIDASQLASKTTNVIRLPK